MPLKFKGTRSAMLNVENGVIMGIARGEISLICSSLKRDRMLFSSILKAHKEVQTAAADCKLLPQGPVRTKGARCVYVCVFVGVCGCVWEDNRTSPPPTCFPVFHCEKVF